MTVAEAQPEVQVTVNPTEREKQSNYWSQHKDAPVLNTMMLDTNAGVLSPKEQAEIQSYLPELDGKDILELGAGIGRYSKFLAERAKSVVAVEFMSSFVEKNKEAHGHLSNLRVVCSDVTGFDMPANSWDLIFSNWLLMYLADGEMQGLTQRALQAVRPGGYVFFRESCFHSSGNFSRSDNPTHYRTTYQYQEAWSQPELATDDGVYVFKLLKFNNVNTYVVEKNNPNQYFWLWQKVLKTPEVSAHNSQVFLDTHQYSRHGILRYERVFGHSYVSTGGEATTKELCAGLDLKKGETVLDIGCGIGGGCYYIAKNFGCITHGIDLSSNMIDIFRERQPEYNMKEITCEVADCTLVDYEPGTWDVLYSRDTLLHIADKPSLFKKFFSWLKPGGRVFITDYCCGDGEQTPEFTRYLQNRGYTLYTVERYGKLLEEAGFKVLRAENSGELFVKCLRAEIERLEKQKDEFVKDFSLMDYEQLMSGWTSKIERVSRGQQTWGIFYAVRT